MEKLFNHTSIFVGIVGGIIAGWLGGWDMLLKTIVFLAAADYVTERDNNQAAIAEIIKKFMMVDM